MARYCSSHWQRLTGGCILVLSLSGCGYGLNNATSSGAASAKIQDQPAPQIVPMGLAATFSVGASGTALQYQWAKNGVNLSGATQSTYVTPATVFADDGASFTVMVSNFAGSVTSDAATLTVGARAPLAGDLRFHQVDALSTLHGYGDAGRPVTDSLTGLNAVDFASSLGAPFSVGGAANCTVQTTASEGSCIWSFSISPLSATESATGLVAGVASGAYSDLQYELSDPNWPSLSDEISPAASTSVATSLDIEAASQLFAVSWVQSQASRPTVFSLIQNTVALDALPSAVAQEGANGRVITAVSFNGGQITYLAYGWSADIGTVYETHSTAVSPAEALTEAAGLAAEGYIITATGTADGAGNVMLVGTRVQGDDLPRSFMTAQGPDVLTMQQLGYATVGVIIVPGQGTPGTYLGER